MDGRLHQGVLRRADIAHRGAPDPVKAEGSDGEVYQQFKVVAMVSQRRLELFRALPFDKLDRFRLTTLTQETGKVLSVTVRCHIFVRP